MEKNSIRLNYIDIAKGIAIVGVIFIHLFGSLASIDPKPFLEPVVTYFSCTMPVAFFILSGMTMRLSNDCDKTFAVFFSRKFKSLMVPYFVFSLINMVHNIADCFLGKNEWDNLSITNLIFDIFTLKGVSVLWFLSTLFGAQLLFYYFYSGFKKNISLSILIVYGIVSLLIGRFVDFAGLNMICVSKLLLVILLYVSRVGLAVLCLLIGYELIRIVESPKYNISKGLESLLGILFLLIAVISVLTGFSGGADFNTMTIGSIPGFIVTSLLGFLSLLFISRSIGNQLVLEYIGRNSLTIMLTHLEFNVVYFSIKFAYTVNLYVKHAKVYVLYFSIFLFMIIFQYMAILLYNFIDSKIKGARH